MTALLQRAARTWVAAEGEVFVQFWLKPRDPPLELAIKEPGEVEGVPEVLRGYL